MSKSEAELRAAIEEVLTLYDVKLEDYVEDPEAPPESRADDFSDIISASQQQLDVLSVKTEEILERTGMTEEQLEAYASNPNNFTKEQWEAIQKVKQACETYKQEARARIGEKEFVKTAEKAEKKRQKGAGKFAKKKQWIPL